MPCVLVVENDPDTLDAVREVLVDEGYTVRSAENGEAAIRQLDGAETPGVILLDTWMPRMNGREFLDWLSLNPQFAGVPVIVVSGDATGFRHPRAAAVLAKPYSAGELLAIVRKFCAGG